MLPNTGEGTFKITKQTARLYTGNWRAPLASFRGLPTMADIDTDGPPGGVQPSSSDEDTDNASFQALHATGEDQERAGYQAGSDRPGEQRDYQGAHDFRETRGADTASLDSRGSEDATRPRTASAAVLEMQAGLRDEAANLLTHTPMVIPAAEAANQDTTTAADINAFANDNGAAIDPATPGSLGHIDPVTGMICVPAAAAAGPSEADHTRMELRERLLSTRDRYRITSDELEEKKQAGFLIFTSSHRGHPAPKP